jgi:cyclic pyranopterin phosphate synthase
VLAGIRAAEAVGFPIKINTVVMRGVNDDEILDFARLTLDKPYAVRFIEYMPTALDPDWRSQLFPGEELLELLAKRFRLRAVERADRSGPARNFAIEGAAGTVGVIAPVTGHFCPECNRIRLTATGTLRDCLFGEKDYDLKPFLRAKDPAAVRVALRRVIVGKPQGPRFAVSAHGHQPFAMASVGG